MPQTHTRVHMRPRSELCARPLSCVNCVMICCDNSASEAGGAGRVHSFWALTDRQRHDACPCGRPRARHTTLQQPLPTSQACFQLVIRWQSTLNCSERHSYRRNQLPGPPAAWKTSSLRTSLTCRRGIRMARNLTRVSGAREAVTSCLAAARSHPAALPAPSVALRAQIGLVRV